MPFLKICNICTYAVKVKTYRCLYSICDLTRRIVQRILTTCSFSYIIYYEVDTAVQPGYLQNLISAKSPCIETRSSSSDGPTLSRPCSSSSLEITGRLFRYASPCRWNKLPASFCQQILIILFLTLLNSIV